MKTILFIRGGIVMKYFNFTKKIKLLYVILGLIFILSISFKIVLSCLSSNNMYIYYNSIVNDEIQQYLLYVAIIVLCIFLVITLKIKVQKIIISIVSIVFLLIISIYSGGFWKADKIYFEFKSPYNNTIIIEECSWLLGGWSNVYQKVSSNIICKLNGNISTDDGYEPFSNNDYNIEWSINSVKITYGFGSGNIHKSEFINLK